MFSSDRLTKGIPLTVATSMAINEHFGADIKYCSNRKEVKDHGDKGILLGSPIADGDKVVIIEDVTTAGTSIEETLPIIKAQGDVDVLGLVVSVDRCERKRREIRTHRDPGEIRFPHNSDRNHEGSR